MGAEVSAGVSQAVTNATEGELKTVAGQLSEAQLKKLSEAIAACGGNPKFDALWPKYEDKMQKGGPESSSKAAIDAFKYNFGVLTSGASTMMGEDALDPVKGLPVYEDLQTKDNPELLKKTVVLKLNGGLGTGMGLDKAKSLLPVTGDKTFLDLIALQVDFMKKKYNMPDMKFMLMNSFSTSKDTLDALKKYTDLGTGSALEFVQNKAPKVTAKDFTPATWEKAPDNEWCPPGHGDLYPAMLGSGTLKTLLDGGFKYMFVSNSDNLGATMDLKLLSYFAESGAPFMMEVATRTDADKKGGHLATLKSTGGLTLRESAQCPKEDEKAFQDTSRYTYFNTNNLWVDLEKLQQAFDKNGGALPLPVMLNDKTVDPRDKQSTKVVQLETAMGAAISCFDGATAIQIPRSRFAPVKKCDDLIALRSDAYVLTEDSRIELAPARNGVPPTIKLDDAYKFVDGMDTLIPNGVPSLIDCTSMKIEGDGKTTNVEFAAGVVIKGDVKFINKSAEKKIVAAGTYENQDVEL
jgi:UDP-N-acetylglucosamine pyrophosphorylase